MILHEVSANYWNHSAERLHGRLMPYLLPRTGKSGGELLNLSRMEANVLSENYETLSRNSGGKIHYALEGLPNKILASEYQIALPKEKDLAEELAKTRKLLESRKFTGKKEATKLNMQYWI